jgi:hypothetical protein
MKSDESGEGFVIEKADGDKRGLNLFWQGADLKSDKAPSISWTSDVKNAVRFFDAVAARKVGIEGKTIITAYAEAASRPKSLGQVFYDHCPGGEVYYEWHQLVADEQEEYEDKARAIVDYWLANDGSKFTR